MNNPGLTAAEAAQRLLTHGPNDIRDQSRRGALVILREQLVDATVGILALAAVVSALLGEHADAIAIAAILVVNGALGFVQDFRAERAVRALKALAAPSARVRRDDEWTSVPALMLVPDDVVALEAGNIVPADVTLFDARRLMVDEAMLTGESLPVEKQPGDVTFRGTRVSAGRGEGVVSATGMRTELGRIAAMLVSDVAEHTPLQRRLAHLGRVAVIAVLVLSAAIFAAGLARGESPALIFMTALSIAVAAIPEALPAVVTVSLALGARKMARQHALIRHLPAVETLGAVTCICCDKTGTLTENRMQAEVVLAGGALEDASTAGESFTLPLHQAMVLCNDVTVAADGTLLGDATEVALYNAGVAALPAFVADLPPRVAELPFSTDRLRMTTVHRDGAGIVAWTKGAPESVLAICDDARGVSGTVALDRDAVLASAHALAEQGMRVLALATRTAAQLPGDVACLERGQTFLGLVGLLDPPRLEARRSIERCQAAGMRVVMITGDHPATALAIARRLGIASDEDAVVTGAELAESSDAELEERSRTTAVFARVAPGTKLRIVEALQRAGEIVAMTGDGVNDAPALERADIGVAMGLGGTDVAREASDMVLLDDRFSTIVQAVHEGRRVHDNVRRFVRYGLTTNAAELLVVLAAPFLGMPLSLLPAQILWVNLVTDGLPGLALAAEPAEDDTMHRPPRDPGESLFARGLWQHAVWAGLLMCVLTLGTQWFAMGRGLAHWQTMTFTVLTFSQCWHVLAIRSEHRSLWSIGITSNPALLAAVAITAAMQLAVIYVPDLRGIFRTSALSMAELGACVAVSFVVLVAVEAEKRMSSIRNSSLRRSGS